MIRRIVMIALAVFMGLCQNAFGREALLFTPERVEHARKMIERDSAFAAGWEKVLREADKIVAMPSVGKVDHAALAWLMTGDEKYADAVKKTLFSAIEAESWGVEEMLMREPAWNSELQMAHRSFAVALAYDAIYDRLTGAERRQLAAGFRRLAIDPLLGDWIHPETRIHSLNSMGHNWWSSCVGMGGILALAFRDEIPQVKEWAGLLYDGMTEWFSFEGDVLQSKPRTFDRNGGMYESVNYAAYGAQEALLYMLACRNAYPRMKFTDAEILEKLPDFFISVSYPRTGDMYNVHFGDSHKTTCGDNCLKLLYAMGDRRPDILWFLKNINDGQHREMFSLSTPMGLLYTPDLSSAPAEPDMKKTALFPDQGWAVMRDSWEDDATMLAVKSGKTWNHAHADAGSFILYHNGEDVLSEAGRCWYVLPEYRNYFFQSEAHNVVLLGGKGQPRVHQYYGSTLNGSLHYLMENGASRYILADATGPNSDRFSRYFRHFLWHDDVIWIIDDLKSHEQGSYSWLWHPGGEARKRGIDLEMSKGRSSVVLRQLYPQTLAPSDFIHDYPDNMTWEVVDAPGEGGKGSQPYYSFHLPGRTDKVKGITAVILKDSPEDKDLPKMERREGKNWIGVRTRSNGMVTDLYVNLLADGSLMHANSWINADGWETDAYMFSVTYPEGQDPAKSKDLFVGYGSILRRDGKVHFSSLSKLFMLRKGDEVVVEGSGKHTKFEVLK